MENSLTILLYKKIDPLILTNHRLIALANTKYKFLTNMITAQLANYGKKYQIAKKDLDKKDVHLDNYKS
jgi:hypothetical protein